MRLSKATSTSAQQWFRPQTRTPISGPSIRSMALASSRGMAKLESGEERRWGMMLSKGIHLNDGTLLLSAGHALTELSINRLLDMSDLLSSQEIVVHEAT